MTGVPTERMAGVPNAVHAYFLRVPCGSMSVAVRLDPALWTRIKNKWLTGKWNSYARRPRVQEASWG